MKGKCDHSSNTRHPLLIIVELSTLCLQSMILGTTVVANFHDLLTLRKAHTRGSSFTFIVCIIKGRMQQDILHSPMSSRAITLDGLKEPQELHSQ